MKVVGSGLRGIRPAGRSAALMSPVLGCAQPSSFTSLRKAPHRPDVMHWRIGADASPRCRSPWASGARRGEVKEEVRAKPGPGDMSSDGHPMAAARADREGVAPNRDRPT